MPQMAPLLWLYLLFFFSLSMILFFMINYYTNFYLKHSFTDFSVKNSEKSWKF